MWKLSEYLGLLSVKTDACSFPHDEGFMFSCIRAWWKLAVSCWFFSLLFPADNKRTDYMIFQGFTLRHSTGKPFSMAGWGIGHTYCIGSKKWWMGCFLSNRKNTLVLSLFSTLSILLLGTHGISLVLKLEMPIQNWPPLPHPYFFL